MDYHEGGRLVKERIDRFLFLTRWLDGLPFLSTKVIRQACLDHDVMLLDTLDRKPKEGVRDLRLLFKFESCWAKEKEAKEIIEKYKRNRIEGLLNVDGNCVEGTSEACGVAWENFHKLLKSEANRNNERILSQIQSSKYFSDGDVFYPKKVYKPSFYWISIASMAKALESRFRWQVGDKKKVRIRVDKWGFEGLDGNSLCVPNGDVRERFVRDLWIPNQLVWNKDHFRELYGEIMEDRIWGCLRCERGEETTIHALKDCPEAHVILTFGGLDGRILDNTYKRCIDWLEDALRLLDKKHLRT
ncbi:hypothetical protein J1N35_004848 [Gossypium stocksii]|uniref:Reverse transcriptase zinc-binding domain-containing protein n=1 Tax=Gossypium stocksii TaxID=47602 RepID=A0A9D3WEE9_9ROSI|nr:hypothetical protein J1N35_004848 [Gossypium stocksii]